MVSRCGAMAATGAVEDGIRLDCGVVKEISRAEEECRRWRWSAAAFEVVAALHPKLALQGSVFGNRRPAQTSRRVRGPLSSPLCRLVIMAKCLTGN